MTAYAVQGVHVMNFDNFICMFTSDAIYFTKEKIYIYLNINLSDLSVNLNSVDGPSFGQIVLSFYSFKTSVNVGKLKQSKAKIQR
jgi:hypothetical protein